MTAFTTMTLSGASLLGRERETRALDDLVERAHDRGGALVIRGEPGIGKSSMLAAAKSRARHEGFQVLTTGGVQSEAHLPFAGLHQLLRPILADVDELPPPQRAAVRAAFGMTDAAAPDLFLIALATLHLLGDAAAHAPVLLLVDDGHWLDRPSADVLAFVARRLDVDPIVLLAAVREGFESPLIDAGLPELRLEGLDAVAAGALLDVHAPDLSTAVRERLLADAEGNPLALVELPAALSSAGVGAGALLPAWLPLTTRLEHAFAVRVSELPDVTRRVLLIAAIDDGGDVAELLSAAATSDGVEATAAALSPAIAARLVEIGETDFRFRHPLVRSAIHQAASVSERRAAHAVMAAALAGQPDRRVWHRAASIVGTDEDVAAELEETAIRAQRRGAIAVAVAALERAARLGDSGRRGKRLLRAAELAFELGRRSIVAPLLEEAAQLELGPLERARMMWIREMIDPGILVDAARMRSIVENADHARATGDADLALNLLWLVASRCWWGNPGDEARESVIAAASRFGPLSGDPRRVAILAYVAPIERGRIVIDQLSRSAADGNGGGAEAASLLGSAAITVGAFDLSTGFLSTSVAGLRAQGRLGHLARLLVLQAWAATHLANWKVAVPAAEEAVRLAAETGEPIWAAGARAVKAMLAALRGELDAAEALAAEAEQVALPIGANFMLAIVQLARGLTALSGARHAEAYEHLRRIFDRADPAYHHFIRCWGIADLADAAVHTQNGKRDAARTLIEELAPLAAQTPSPWFHMGMRYARPLLADDEEAEQLFEASLDADMTRWPVYRARLQLAFGSWLRRQRRVVESRAPLRAARDAFDALGVIPWGERARQELRASGETSRRRTPGVWDDLSPQELQIAQMAADGMSNKEIGQQLYLSHRTVGSHLYRIFPKLGITARSQLRGVLDA